MKFPIVMFIVCIASLIVLMQAPSAIGAGGPCYIIKTVPCIPPTSCGCDSATNFVTVQQVQKHDDYTGTRKRAGKDDWHNPGPSYTCAEDLQCIEDGVCPNGKKNYKPSGRVPGHILNPKVDWADHVLIGNSCP